MCLFKMPMNVRISHQDASTVVLVSTLKGALSVSVNRVLHNTIAPKVSVTVASSTVYEFQLLMLLTSSESTSGSSLGGRCIAVGGRSRRLRSGECFRSKSEMILYPDHLATFGRTLLSRTHIL